jgi:hypothetical protein
LESADRRIKRKRVDLHLAQRLREAQKPTSGAIAGAITAIASAMLWLVVALSSGGLPPAMTFWMFPIMMIAIAAASGFAVGYFGRGVEPKFGIMAVAFTLVGWLSGLGLIAYALQASPLLILSAIPASQHILVSFIGLIVAYRFSFLWLPRSQKWAMSDERGSLAKRE